MRQGGRSIIMLGSVFLLEQDDNDFYHSSFNKIAWLIKKEGKTRKVPLKVSTLASCALGGLGRIEKCLGGWWSIIGQPSAPFLQIASQSSRMMTWDFPFCGAMSGRIEYIFTVECPLIRNPRFLLLLSSSGSAQNPFSSMKAVAFYTVLPWPNFFALYFSEPL